MPLEAPVCSEVWSSGGSSSAFVVTLSDGRATVRSLDGIEGPKWFRVPDDARASLGTFADVCFVAGYGEGVVYRIEARTGAIQWKASGFKRLDSMASLAKSLLVLQVSGTCSELDVETGAVRASRGGVRGMISDPLAGRALLVRRSPGSRHSVLEIVSTLEEPPLWSVHTSVENFRSHGAFCRGHIIVADSGSDALVCYTDTGDVAWSRPPKERCYWVFAAALRAENACVAFERAHDTGRNVAHILDPPSGQTVREAPINTQNSWFIPVADGTKVVSCYGVLDVASMTWEERQWTP